MPIRYGNSKTDKILYNETQIKKILKDGQLVFQNNKAFYYVGGYRPYNSTTHSVFKLNDKLEVISSRYDGAKELLDSCYFGDDIVFIGNSHADSTNNFHDAFMYDKKLSMISKLDHKGNYGTNKGGIVSSNNSNIYLGRAGSIVSKNSVVGDKIVQDKFIQLGTNVPSYTGLQGIGCGYFYNKETIIVTYSGGGMAVYDEDLNFISSIKYCNLADEISNPVQICGNGLRYKYIGVYEGTNKVFYLMKFNEFNGTYAKVVSYSIPNGSSNGFYRDIIYSEYDGYLYILESKKITKLRILDSGANASVELIASVPYSNGWGLSIGVDGKLLLLCDSGVVEVIDNENITNVLVSKKITNANMLRTSVTEKL